MIGWAVILFLVVIAVLAVAALGAQLDERSGRARVDLRTSGTFTCSRCTRICRDCRS